MRPVPGEVLHFSDDPSIAGFVPHVAVTSQEPLPYVWAVDAEQAPSYWFPRDCPRLMAWVGPNTTADACERFLGPGGGDRVHAVEYGWLERMRTVRLYAYRLPAAPFRPIGEPRPHAMVAEQPVTPLGPARPVGDLFACTPKPASNSVSCPTSGGSWTRSRPARWSSAASACATQRADARSVRRRLDGLS